MFEIAKQNRINPKYILISSSLDKPTTNLKPLQTAPLDKFKTSQKNTLTKFQTSKSILRKESFKPISKEIMKNLDTIRGDLNECMNNIISEEKKNKIFKDLIQVLQSEMKKIEENEKHVNEVQQEENLKKAHKVQYDIEQILQKYNQEVARIHNLKEQVASSRSDRVVFSNLFKKIEKEIKQNQEYYKSLIVKTEINREKLAEKQLKQLELTQQLSLDQAQPREDQFHISDKNVGKPATAAASRLFLTNPMMASGSAKKATTKAERSSEQMSSMNLKFIIEEVQTKIEKLIKTTECDSLKETLNAFDQISAENERLSLLVNEEDRKIEEAQAEIERIRQERRVSEIYESRHIIKLESLPSTRKVRSIKTIKTAITEQGDKNDQNMQIFSTIFDFFNLSKDKDISTLISNEEALASLEKEIDNLSNSKTFKKSDSNLSISNTEHGLDHLLTKMQRFDTCDRILSKTQFYTQYTKELSKNKRLKSKK